MRHRGGRSARRRRGEIVHLLALLVKPIDRVRGRLEAGDALLEDDHSKLLDSLALFGRLDADGVLLHEQIVQLKDVILVLSLLRDDLAAALLAFLGRWLDLQLLHCALGRLLLDRLLGSQLLIDLPLGSRRGTCVRCNMNQRYACAASGRASRLRDATQSTRS